MYVRRVQGLVVLSSLDIHMNEREIETYTKKRGYVGHRMNRREIEIQPFYAYLRRWLRSSL